MLDGYMSNSPAPFRLDLISWQEGVTGSMTLLRITFSDKREVYGLVDAGIVMDDNAKNLETHFDPKLLDFILITHPHADHIALLPRLYHNGCTAPIYTTHMSDTLMQTALMDAEKIMTNNCKFFGGPLWYNPEDTQNVLRNIVGNTFFREFEVALNTKVILADNGHLMGAAVIFLKVDDTDTDESIVYVFSGDYKPTNKLKKIRGISLVKKLWHLDDNIPINCLIESTYGENGRAEGRFEDEREDKFYNELIKGIEENKSIFCPCLALERPDLLLFDIKRAQDNGVISADIPIYIVGDGIREFTKQGMKYADVDFKPKNLQFIRYCLRKKEDNSMELIPELTIEKNKPIIVIASSGMCQHGSSVSLIREYLPDRRVKIIFSCYLAEGTLGLEIKNTEIGNTDVIQGCSTPRYAEIVETKQFSGHASPDELVDFLKSLGNVKFIAVHHGDKQARADFSKRLLKEFPESKVVEFGEGYYFRTGPWGLVTPKVLPKFLET